jgi:hypothetical protein
MEEKIKSALKAIGGRHVDVHVSRGKLTISAGFSDDEVAKSDSVVWSLEKLPRELQEDIASVEVAIIENVGNVELELEECSTHSETNLRVLTLVWQLKEI